LANYYKPLQTDHMYESNKQLWNNYSNSFLAGLILKELIKARFFDAEVHSAIAFPHMFTKIMLYFLNQNPNKL